ALALALLPGVVARGQRTPRLMRALRAGYERALGRALARPTWVVAGSVLAGVGGMGLGPVLPLEVLPEVHETNFVMHMTGAPGVGLAESARVGAAAAQAVLGVPGVRSVAQQIGRSTLSEDSWGAERSELLVRLDSAADAERVTEAIHRKVQ